MSHFIISLTYSGFKTLAVILMLFSVIFNSACNTNTIKSADTSNSIDNTITEANNSQKTDDSEEESMKKLAKLLEKPAPDFALKDLAGKEYKLSDFRGKYVFLDFWGTWCGPCVEGLPHIKETYDTADKNKVVFIGVCHECEDLRAFLKENDYPWLQLQSNEKAVADYKVEFFPTPILIDPEGNILITGHLSDDYKRFSDLKKLLNEYIK